jgi:hypothetical protein
MFSTLTATTPFLLRGPPVSGSVALAAVLSPDVRVGDTGARDEGRAAAGDVVACGSADAPRVAAIPAPPPATARAATTVTAV